MRRERAVREQKINAARVKGRRAIRFASLDDVLGEARRLLADDARVVSLANMRPAQAVEHLARWVDASVDGVNLPPPPLLKFLAPLLKPLFLSAGLPAGAKLPAEVQERFTPGRDTQAAPALAHLETAVARFRDAKALAPSLAFGRLSREEWERLHCRHAELHFSFQLPNQPDAVKP
jgi:Protein of unknown function (DUF1569)